MSLKSCVSCFSFRAQRVSQEQTAYLLGRGASFSNRISIQLLLLEELKTLTQEMSSWTHLCDGTTETWWNCRARQRPHRKPVERWCPRDGDSHHCILHLFWITSAHVFKKIFTKGMSSHIPHYSLFTGQIMALLQPVPAVVKASQAPPTWFLMTSIPLDIEFIWPPQ